MKKIKFQKKLFLNKESIAKLNEYQMDQLKGAWSAHGYDCREGGYGMFDKTKTATRPVTTHSNFCSNLCSMPKICNRYRAYAPRSQVIYQNEPYVSYKINMLDAERK